MTTPISECANFGYYFPLNTPYIRELKNVYTLWDNIITNYAIPFEIRDYLSSNRCNSVEEMLSLVQNLRRKIPKDFGQQLNFDLKMMAQSLSRMSTDFKVIEVPRPTLF